MVKIRFTRPVIAQGRPRVIGEVLEVTPAEWAMLARHAVIVKDGSEPPEPERTVMTTAESATVAASRRTMRRP